MRIARINIDFSGVDDSYPDILTTAHHVVLHMIDNLVDTMITLHVGDWAAILYICKCTRTS
jgi:hypothetical protein